MLCSLPVLINLETSLKEPKESVQITIPADALNSLTTADSEPSKMCIDAFYLLLDCGV